MALTMVHLLAADRWAAGHPEFAECPEFYLGVISPDAIHIRDHDDKSRKDLFHLYNWQAPHPEKVVEYWRDWRSPFDIGYGVHVLTDCQWVPRFKARLRGMFRPDGKLNTDIYYNDTFVTDFKMYRESPRLQALLTMIERARLPLDHPLLTRDEFDAWRRLILEAYRGECPRHDPVRFIDVDYVRSFVVDCIPMIDRVFAEAFASSMP